MTTATKLLEKEIERIEELVWDLHKRGLRKRRNYRAAEVERFQEILERFEDERCN